MTKLSAAILPVLLLAAAAVPGAAQTTIGQIKVHYTVIDVPGAGYTNLWGINSAGVMVGNYGSDVNTDSHGFSYTNGIFSYIDYPGAPQGVTLPTKINDAGAIVGVAGNAPIYGFTYDGATFTTILHGDDDVTATYGINNAGQIAGGAGSLFATRGFEWQDGKFRKLNVPGTTAYINASGINNHGAISGWTGDEAFQCQPGGRNCRLLDYPGASITRAWGNNDSGMIVGWYNQSTSTSYAFVYSGGRFLNFGIPGAVFTAAVGINNLGQVVGSYYVSNSEYHGFVTEPITTVSFRGAEIAAGLTEDAVRPAQLRHYFKIHGVTHGEPLVGFMNVTK